MKQYKEVRPDSHPISGTCEMLKPYQRFHPDCCTPMLYDPCQLRTLCINGDTVIVESLICGNSDEPVYGSTKRPPTWRLTSMEEALKITLCPPCNIMI